MRDALHAPLDVHRRPGQAERDEVVLSWVGGEART